MTDEFIGGSLCLDFANTVDWRGRPEPEELLDGYADLVAWSVRAGSLSRAEARRLTAAAGESPGAAGAAFGDAVALREAFYRTAVAHARGEKPPPEDVADVVRSYADAVEKAELTLDGASYEWTFDGGGDLARAWWPIAVSAVELLKAPELARVRECAGRGCGWLFLDESRSRTRRWCSAASCGNRERVRRYYERRTTSQAIAS
jgi:predicted RNA-binding Zn ribbon-like protein